MEGQRIVTIFEQEGPEECEGVDLKDLLLCALRFLPVQTKKRK